MKDRHELAEKWFRKADGDLRAIQALIDIEGYDTACFHAQQAIEKYLKGFIELHGTSAPHIHNLVEPNKQCVKRGATWNLDLPMLAELTSYAVENRYELDFSPSKQQAQQAHSQAHQICQTILAAQRKLKAK